MAPAMIPGPRPSNTPTRITVSKAMSAARKLGTVTRTHTPSVRGTQMKASSPMVWPSERCLLKSRSLNTRDRASAEETAAATPSWISSVISTSFSGYTLLLYPQAAGVGRPIAPLAHPAASLQ